jgi:hypothetical protein
LVEQLEFGDGPLALAREAEGEEGAGYIEFMGQGSSGPATGGEEEVDGLGDGMGGEGMAGAEAMGARLIGEEVIHLRKR